MTPKPVYELLPYLYVCAGIGALLYLDTVMAFVSGLLMSITGVVVLWLRRNYRQTQLVIDKAWQPE